MKWVIIESRYNIKVVEAETIEEAARSYFQNKPPSRKTVSVVDIELERVRQFNLIPPPAPPVSEWMVKEEIDDEEEPDFAEDDEDDSRF